MDIGVIAKRYAKALIEFAVEEKKEALVYDEIQTLIQSYREVPQLAAVLAGPVLPQDQKVSVLCQAVSKTGKCSDVFQKFASLVVAHRRESFMLFIAYNYVTLYRELKHISIGKLITPVAVSPEVAKRLKDLVKQYSADSTEVILEESVDPSLIGGFIFQIDDMRMDASVRYQFEQIKKQFIEQNKRII